MSGDNGSQQRQPKAFVSEEVQRVNYEGLHLLARFILKLLPREKLEPDRREIITGTIQELTTSNDNVYQHDSRWEKPIVDGLIFMADDIHERYKVDMDKLVEKIPPHCQRQIFMKVCLEIIEKQKLHWGHVAILFYFAFRLIIRAVDLATQSYNWIKSIFSWALDFFSEYLSNWIVKQGGWNTILNSLSKTNIPWFWIGLGSTAIIVIALVVWWRKRE